MDDRTRPSTAFLDHATAGITARMAQVTAPDVLLDAYPAQRSTWAAATEAADALEPALTELLTDLHAHPELAFEEHRSQAVLVELLESRGFTVEQGVHGVGTSLRTSYSTAGFDPARHRTVAIMAEYDAWNRSGYTRTPLVPLPAANAQSLEEYQDSVYKNMMQPPSPRSGPMPTHCCAPSRRRAGCWPVFLTSVSGLDHGCQTAGRLTSPTAAVLAVGCHQMMDYPE